MATNNSLNNIVTDNNFVVATGNLIVAGNVTSLGGGFTGVTNITTVGGNITASVGTVTAGTGLVVSTGNASINTGDVNIVGPSGVLNIGTSTPSNPYDLSIDRSLNGRLGISIQNQSAGGSAASTMQCITEPATHDAFCNYIINGGQNWSVGLDNSDSDGFKITTGVDPSNGTEVFNATTTGTVNLNGGPVNIGTNNAANAITIGTGTSGRAINIGRSAAAHTMTLGNTNTTTSVDIASGTGNMLLNSAGTNTLTGTGGVTIQSTNTAMNLTSGTGALRISADAAATTVELGTGAAVKTVTIGSTNSTSATTIQSGSGALNVTSTNGALTINSGTGALGISTDASATTVSLATGGAVKTVTLGSTNSTSVTTIACGTGGANFGTSANAHTTTIGSTTTTSSTVIQSGTGDVIVTSTDAITLDSAGVLELNSSAGVISIGNDAVAQNINIGTGAAARTITIGNTSGATAVNIDIGTGDFTMDSATGRIITALDTGEITYPLLPAFLAYNSATDTNVTGAGADYTVICDTEVFDQGADYNNATGIFTAPITGRYDFGGEAVIIDTTIATTFNGIIVTSNGVFLRAWTRAASVLNASCFCDCLADMDAADTAFFRVNVAGEAGNTADVYGAADRFTSFWGRLAC